MQLRPSFFFIRFYLMFIFILFTFSAHSIKIYLISFLWGVFMYHRTYVKVDLDAIEYNVNNILEKINNKSKLLIVVKADSYGHGSVEVSRFLQDKCDFFGVACVDEAMELVEAGINKPILVLGYVSPSEYETVVKYDLRIPIFTYENAIALSAEAGKQGKVIPYHFCVDTGMSRIGFQVNEKNADMCRKIADLPNIQAEGIFSHFATADESDLTKTYNQLALFKKFIEMLSERGVIIPIKHLNNSAGIMMVDDCFDMVRSGIVTYGLYPSEDVDKSRLSLKPAMEWKTHISYVKTLEAGREISYGGTYVTKNDTVVATVPVGYADGYPRCLSNVGRVIVNGHYANIIGRVCMDQFMIDVTDISDVKVEDEVTLVGKDGDAVLTMEEISNNAHSFNYELPCKIARRVPRVYYKNGKMIKIVKNIFNR